METGFTIILAREVVEHLAEQVEQHGHHADVHHPAGPTYIILLHKGQ